MIKNTEHWYIAIYIILLAWVAFAVLQIADSDFLVASAFGLSAYVIMWAHYFNGFIKDRFAPESSTKKSYEVTRPIVLPAIIIHAFLINLVLFNKGYGLPPGNYSFFGNEKLYIYLGVMALIIFFIFDIKNHLPRKYKMLPEHLSRIAMVIISIHGLVLGYTLSNPTNRYVFYFLVATLLLMVGRLYVREKNKIILITGATALAIIIGFFIVSKIQNTEEPKAESSNTQEVQQETNQQATTTNQTKTVTKSELGINNGKGGNPCWVAVDGTVYNLTTSDKWSGGEHTTTSGVECGNDLSDKIGQSPHGKSTLSKYPVVGTLE